MSGAAAGPAPGPLEQLLGLLRLEQGEADVFSGRSPQEETVHTIFGGQLLAQALAAAGQTVSGMEPHSLHAYFLRPGDATQPITFSVARTRDGRSYSARRVVASQNGGQILDVQASFHVAEHGDDYQQDPPAGVTVPEQISADDRCRSPHDFLDAVRPIETRIVPVSAADRRYVWLRAGGRLDADPLTHLAVAAYASDFSFITTAAFANPPRPAMLASIDHAVWFHRRLRADEWLLYEQEAAVVHGGRAFCRGRMWTRDGALVLSTGQEGVFRR